MTSPDSRPVSVGPNPALAFPLRPSPHTIEYRHDPKWVEKLLNGLPIVTYLQRTIGEIGEYAMTDQPTAGVRPEAVSEVTLNPSDPFESVLIEMVNVSRRKANDYAASSDRFSNFRESGALIGLTPFQACMILVGTKVSRLKNLIGSGRPPANESIRDTLVDVSNYMAISVALWDEANQIGDAPF